MQPDDTVRLSRTSAAARARHPDAVPGAIQRRNTGRLILAGLAGIGALAGGYAWREAARDPAPPVADPPSPPPPAAAGPPLRSTEELAAAPPTAPTVARWRDNPRVFVLLFPDLEGQGAAMNRLAALVEKAGLPRDRLLDDAALAAAIARSGDTAATWYLGHDYRGADVARFLALAERDGTPLHPPERWVADTYRQARALVPDGEVALVSIGGSDRRMDPELRAAILRHELAHGDYFTRPEFAAHVRRVWAARFTESDRAALRAFLGREGYDTGNDDLMANESMAYLLHTPDPRLFRPEHVGTDAAGLERLRGLLRDGSPLP